MSRWGRRLRRWRRAGCARSGPDFPVLSIRARATNTRSRAPSAKSGAAIAALFSCRGPEVTLEEDLARRDLTINAVALGRAKRRDDRSVRRARRFAAQAVAACVAGVRRRPVAGFAGGAVAAMLPDFSLDAATAELMRQIVAAGEIEHLARERIGANCKPASASRRRGG